MAVGVSTGCMAARTATRRSRARGRRRIRTGRRRRAAASGGTLERDKEETKINTGLKNTYGRVTV